MRTTYYLLSALGFITSMISLSIVEILRVMARVKG